MGIDKKRGIARVKGIKWKGGLEREAGLGFVVV